MEPQNRSEGIADLAAALVAAQGEFPTIPKAKIAKLGTYSYHYADLADVLSAVRPVLAKHGLALVQPIRTAADRLVVETVLLHKTGQWLSGSQDVERHQKPQEQGSELTYARRYGVTSMLGIAAEEDDDGKAAQEAKPTAPPKAKVPPRETDTTTRPATVSRPAPVLPPCPVCGSVKAVVLLGPGEYRCEAPGGCRQEWRG